MTLTHSHITLQGLRFRALHGVMPQENVVGADFIVDVTAAYDASRAMLSDNVDDAVSYAMLYDIIKEEMAKPSKLIENVAWRITQHISQSCPAITHIEVTLTKCNPPMGADTKGAAITLKFNTDSHA